MATTDSIPSNTVSAEWAANTLRQIASQADATANLLDKASAEGDPGDELKSAAASLARHAGLVAELALARLGDSYAGTDHWTQAGA